MSTTNSSPKSPKNKIIYSILLSLIFVGIFFFSYYIYNLLSVNFFKENYRSYIGEFLSQISQEVQTDLHDNGIVNINRIIEPYLNEEVNLLIVYRTNQELMQVFTKKGVTKDNLRIADQTYFLNQTEAESVYLDEESPFVIADATNKRGLILGSITPATIGVANFPYHYVLVFAVDDYFKSRKVLEATINRNSFLGGISMLALIGLVFLIKEISSHLREKKNRKKEIEAIKHSAISTSTPSAPPTATPTDTDIDTGVDIDTDTTNKNANASNTPTTNTPTTSSVASTEPTFELEDFIDHDENDPMFGDDVISASSSFEPVISATPNSSIPDQTEQDQDHEDEEADEEAIQIVKEKNRKFLKDFLEYFLTSHAPSTYVALENETNTEIIHSNGIQDGIRDFNTIENERANLEQSRCYSHRLKLLLQIWILAHPSPTSNLEKEYLTRIKKSLEIIGEPLPLTRGNSQQNGFGASNASAPTGPVADYALPDLVVYFRPEHDPREVTGKPVLTILHPEYVTNDSSYLSSMASVPWLGEEKKFFKLGEPYLEKKERAIGITTHSIIEGKPHIIKLIYTLEKYDRLTYETKNHLLYLVDLLYKLIADAPMREEELFFSKHGFENKVRNFFRRVFQYEGVVERLFSDDNPLFKLHFSLWTFSQGTLKNTKAKFTELMKTLPSRLSTSFSTSFGTTYNEVVFLSDNESRIVSIGFDPPTAYIEDTHNTTDRAIVLSTRIKEAIEQELIDDVGMESMGIEWKETILQPPTSEAEAQKINIDIQ